MPGKLSQIRPLKETQRQGPVIVEKNSAGCNALGARLVALILNKCQKYQKDFKANVEKVFSSFNDQERIGSALESLKDSFREFINLGKIQNLSQISDERIKYQVVRESFLRFNDALKIITSALPEVKRSQSITKEHNKELISFFDDEISHLAKEYFGDEDQLYIEQIKAGILMEPLWFVNARGDRRQSQSAEFNPERRDIFRSIRNADIKQSEDGKISINIKDREIPNGAVFNYQTKSGQVIGAIKVNSSY